MKSIRAGHCWVHKRFEHVQNVRTDLPKLHWREEHFSNWLSLSLLEWPGMITRTNSNCQFVLIREYIRHSGTGALDKMGDIWWKTIYVKPHVSQNKSFNIPFSIGFATLAHILNGYHISLNITDYPNFNM